MISFAMCSIPPMTPMMKILSVKDWISLQASVLQIEIEMEVENSPPAKQGGNFFIGKCDILYHIIDRIHKIKKQIRFIICAILGLFTAYAVFSVQINTIFEFHRHLSINMAKYIHRMHLSDGEIAMLHRERRTN